MYGDDEDASHHAEEKDMPAQELAALGGGRRSVVHSPTYPSLCSLLVEAGIGLPVMILQSPTPTTKGSSATSA